MHAGTLACLCSVDKSAVYLQDEEGWKAAPAVACWPDSYRAFAALVERESYDGGSRGRGGPDSRACEVGCEMQAGAGVAFLTR